MDSISRWSPNYRFHRSLAMLQSPSFRQGLPESSHRDVNLGADREPKSNIYVTNQLPSMALDSGIHAGMTGGVDYRVPWVRGKGQSRSPDGASGGIRGNLTAQSRISLCYIRATVLVFEGAE